MNKKCARCEKIVYPIEELKCLDKVWHKGCFKCQECGMTLSMRTYKGFNKFPYCESHIPKAKATSVAETPEMKRLAENTKIQSNVKYHAEFEKNKAKFTQVADDPETLRIKQNTKIISNICYHGDMEKKAQMEKKRCDVLSDIQIKDDAISRKDKDELQNSSSRNQSTQNVKQLPTQLQSKPMMHPTQPMHSLNQFAVQQKQQVPHPIQSSHFHKVSTHAMHQQQQAYRGPAVQPAKQVASSLRSPYYNQQQHAQPNSQSYYPTNMSTQGYHHHPQQNNFQDSNHNSPYSDRNSQTLIYSSQMGGVPQEISTKHVGNIADYDPINDQYGSISSQKQNHQLSGGYRQETTYQAPRGNMYSDNQPPVQQKVNAPPTQLGRCFRAIYDYEAADTDEVSFRDGDLLINCTSIDEGWMAGTVQRTGRVGMLPANYVERVS